MNFLKILLIVFFVPGIKKKDRSIGAAFFLNHNLIGD